MDKDEKHYAQYELNKKLIDFDFIPPNLSEEFMIKIKNKK